jgi:hypothetical protein
VPDSVVGDRGAGLTGRKGENKMGTFHEVNFEGLSISECDIIALDRAGVIYCTGYSYALPRGGDVNEEYSSIVVNKQGMGNHGRIVLRGKTPRARALIREGKILSLTRQGIPWRVARVACQKQYGMEPQVARFAADLVATTRFLGPFKGRSHAEFKQWAGSWVGEVDLSFPRKSSAADIAAAVCGSAPA